MAAVNELIKQAVTHPDSRYAYISPNYKMSKDIAWDYLKHYSRVIPHIKINESELKIDYPNGARIKLYGGDTPDTLRGLSLWGVVFDEYAQVKENVFTEVIRPALADHQGWATFIGTPKGTNHFWRMFIKATQEEDWLAARYPWQHTGALPTEEVEASRKDMPQDLFQQEYECEFLDNAGAFFRRVKENTYKGQPKDGKDFQTGVDLAKFQDWTVITPFCLNTMQVHAQERFNQIDYNLQKARIETHYLRFKSQGSNRVVIDSTGVGEPVYDDLRLRGLDIKPFHFTGVSRELLLRHLQLLIEQDKIQLPDDEGLQAELLSMQYALGKTGKVKIQVPDGMTDDRIMSLALAVWEVNEPVKPIDSSLYESQIHEFLYPKKKINLPTLEERQRQLEDARDFVKK